MALTAVQAAAPRHAAAPPTRVEHPNVKVVVRVLVEGLRPPRVLKRGLPPDPPPGPHKRLSVAGHVCGESLHGSCRCTINFKARTTPPHHVVAQRQQAARPVRRIAVYHRAAMFSGTEPSRLMVRQPSDASARCDSVHQSCLAPTGLTQAHSQQTARVRHRSFFVRLSLKP